VTLFFEPERTLASHSCASLARANFFLRPSFNGSHFPPRAPPWPRSARTRTSTPTRPRRLSGRRPRTTSSGDDLAKYGGAHSAKASFKTPLPVFFGPDRARLSKNAAKALDEAVAVFERHMAVSCDVPTISNLLTAKRKVEYDLNTEEGKYRLFLSSFHLPGEKDCKVTFQPVQHYIDPSMYKPVIDFHLQGDAFKAFRAHVSRYPGCDAKHVALTDLEKKERGITSKSKSTVTHVAISLEGCEAFRERREWPMSDDMQTSLRFYQERCAKFGVPKGFGKENGFCRIETTLSSFWEGRRPNWRVKADQPKTGDPDSPFTTQELMAQYAERFMDGYADGYEDY
jgi:hypothetical protein